MRVRVRSPDGVESVRTVMRENVERGHRNALGKLLPVLALCLTLSACKAKRPELHPCNSLPPDAYPSWCMGLHRQLPPETRRLYPPSPSPKPRGR